MFKPEDLDFDLHGVPKAPTIEIERESPRARIMLVLKAQNFSNLRIHEELEKMGMPCCMQTISYTTRQSWFLKELVKLLAIRGADFSKKMELYEDDAINTLVSVMLNEEESGRTRAQCAVDYLKAKNGIKLITEEKPRDLSALQKEKEQLEQELKELTPRNRIPILIGEPEKN